MSPLNQQLDIDGGRHDIAPAHETVKLFDSAPQIRGQIALETDWCDQAGCRTTECVGCIEQSALAGARSFYVHRFAPDGHEGWTGSLRPLSRALHEAQAWISCGWAAELLPNTLAVRREVRLWQQLAQERRSGGAS